MTCNEIDKFVFLSTMEKDYRKRIKAYDLYKFVNKHFN